MRSGRVLSMLLGAGLFAAMALPATAVTVVDQGQEDGSLFGMIDQNTPGITNGDQACAPTATYNSFVYLNNAFPSAGIGGLLGTGPVSAINTLAGDIPGGIPASGGNALAAGKTQYISDKGLSGKITVEQLGNNGKLDPNAAAEFIAAQLAAGQDVEMGFVWTDANGNPTNPPGGHVVTITGIDYDEGGQNGSMNIIDPWDGVALSPSLSVANGGLLLSYTGGGAGSGGADGADPDNPAAAGQGYVSFVTAESVVPEPTVAMLGLVLLGGLGLRRRADR